MQLREMRYARIEDTEVMVEVKSAAEAKAAIRELRHKKKELRLLKRRLLRNQSAARRALARAERDRERLAQKKGVIAALRRVSRVLRRNRPSLDLAAIDREVEATDEILHNIDSCIVQIEGKLLV